MNEKSNNSNSIDAKEEKRKVGHGRVTAVRGSVRDENHFVKEVRRQAERARRGRQMNFWQGLSLVGAVGWMVVAPALAGAFIGRWLDQRFEKGIF
jgi:predicted F0F1-ATPase subunit